MKRVRRLTRAQKIASGAWPSKPRRFIKVAPLARCVGGNIRDVCQFCGASGRESCRDLAML